MSKEKTPIERCPNRYCGDSGCIPHGSNEHGWEPEQCEWCYTMKNSYFNATDKEREEFEKREQQYEDACEYEQAQNTIGRF